MDEEQVPTTLFLVLGILLLLLLSLCIAWIIVLCERWRRKRKFRPGNRSPIDAERDNPESSTPLVIANKGILFKPSVEEWINDEEVLAAAAAGGHQSLLSSSGIEAGGSHSEQESLLNGGVGVAPGTLTIHQQIEAILSSFRHVDPYLPSPDDDDSVFLPDGPQPVIIPRKHNVSLAKPLCETSLKKSELYGALVHEKLDLNEEREPVFHEVIVSKKVYVCGESLSTKLDIDEVLELKEPVIHEVIVSTKAYVCGTSLTTTANLHEGFEPRKRGQYEALEPNKADLHQASSQSKLDFHGAVQPHDKNPNEASPNKNPKLHEETKAKNPDADESTFPIDPYVNVVEAIVTEHFLKNQSVPRIPLRNRFNVALEPQKFSFKTSTSSKTRPKVDEIVDKSPAKEGDKALEKHLPKISKIYRKSGTLMDEDPIKESSNLTTQTTSPATKEGDKKVLPSIEDNLDWMGDKMGEIIKSLTGTGPELESVKIKDSSDDDSMEILETTI